MKAAYKITQYVAENVPIFEVTKKGGVKLTIKMPRMEGYYLKVDSWNLAASHVLMEGWKEGSVYAFEGEFSLRHWIDEDGYSRCAATVNLTEWNTGGQVYKVSQYDEVWREAEVLKYVLTNWDNGQLVKARGPKKLVGEKLTEALHTLGVSKGKRLLVDEEGEGLGLAQKAKRSRVAPEVLSRIIEGLKMEERDQKENVPFPQKKDRFWSVMAGIDKQWKVLDEEYHVSLLSFQDPDDSEPVKTMTKPEIDLYRQTLRRRVRALQPRWWCWSVGKYIYRFRDIQHGPVQEQRWTNTGRQTLWYCVPSTRKENTKPREEIEREYQRLKEFLLEREIDVTRE
ncbi:hypothetical protein G6F37_008662 [Rhizopus arrhizus]|nr:hypothetical protein G6F37_008662 [Rhizopus arrhizus]